MNREQQKHSSLKGLRIAAAALGAAILIFLILVISTGARLLRTHGDIKPSQTPEQTQEQSAEETLPQVDLFADFDGAPLY